MFTDQLLSRFSLHISRKFRKYPPDPLPIPLSSKLGVAEWDLCPGLRHQPVSSSKTQSNSLLYHRWAETSFPCASRVGHKDLPNLPLSLRKRWCRGRVRSNCYISLVALFQLTVCLGLVNIVRSLLKLILKMRIPSLKRNACDFFLWGYLKAKVYTHKPKTLDELKDAIRLEIAAMVEKVMLNFRERLHKCIENEGKHLDDTIFRATKPRN
ncbi:hypothetical protein AVEN_274114-1 [Araneus ventricosus]|uniref:Uncharacterized protein n=1 Tax=Araneus ventricosus TaxID=182803 RepID=A0A4Y2R7G7_ARAVE|nr:hypothetical protein AVEN_274114-1 [Araneus ventricosus]